jgi:hypothetical protein
MRNVTKMVIKNAPHKLGWNWSVTKEFSDGSPTEHIEHLAFEEMLAEVVAASVPERLLKSRRCFTSDPIPALPMRTEVVL